MSRVSIILYIAIFITVMLMTSFLGFSETEGAYKDTALPIAVIDRDGSEASKALAAYLGERHVLAGLPDESEKLQDSLFYRDVEYILFIPEGFESKLLRGEEGNLLENAKLPKSTAGIYLDNQINRYVATVKAYLNAGFTVQKSLESAAVDLRFATDVETQSAKPEETATLPFFFKYLAYILMTLIISTLGAILITFNRSDLARRIESSSTKLRERNTQIFSGVIISALVIWAVFIIIAFIVFGGEMLGVIPALHIANNFIFLLVCVSIAFLLGQFMKTAATLNAVNTALSLGMSFLCGIFVPQELMGSNVQVVAKFLPAYWYVKINDMLSAVIELTASAKREYFEGLGIQLAFAAAIFAVALVVSRQKKINSAM